MTRKRSDLGNGAPQCRWAREGFEGDGYYQERLYVAGRRTPFFLHIGTTIGHRTQGEKVGLFGAGMHPKGYAMQLGCGPRIRDMKHRGEQMALNA